MIKSKIKVLFPTIILIILIIIFRSQLFKFISDNSSLLGLIVAILSPFFSIYYLKSEKFYLFIQKNFVLPFLDTHSKWKLIVFYEISESDYPSLEILVQKIYDLYKSRYSNFKILNKLKNLLEIQIDDEIIYKFSFQHVNDSLSISFSTSKFTVPSTLYERKIKDIILLLKDIESILKPGSQDYQLDIFFGMKNPYFGYFVRHIPQKLISDFNFNFYIEKSNETRIQATKEAIIIHSKNFIQLEKYTIDYLSLSTNLITNSG